MCNSCHFQKDRLVAYSILRIQGVVRGFLARSRMKKMLRSKYEEVANQGTCDSLEKHGEQIGRLIVFFDPTQQKDGSCYSQHALQMLQYKTQILERCFTDPLWSHRIRIFVRIGMIWFLEETGAKRRSQSHRSGLKFLLVIIKDIVFCAIQLKILIT